MLLAPCDGDDAEGVRRLLAALLIALRQDLLRLDAGMRVRALTEGDRAGLLTLLGEAQFLVWASLCSWDDAERFRDLLCEVAAVPGGCWTRAMLEGWLRQREWPLLATRLAEVSLNYSAHCDDCDRFERWLGRVWLPTVQMLRPDLVEAWWPAGDGKNDADALNPDCGVRRLLLS